MEESDMISYSDNKKYAYFDGLKFTRDEKTGYYLNSTIRERLHRYIWKHCKGEIPKGFHVHHKDRDKSNNDIKNLILVAPKKHTREHGKERAGEDTKWLRNFNEKGREKAKEWHKSKEGREWHKKHYQQNKDKLHKLEKFICVNCGEEFERTKNGNNRFCENKCKSQWRRKQGLDDETRVCKCCGKEFTANKYSKTKTCSMSCSNKLYPRLPQLKDN